MTYQAVLFYSQQDLEFAKGVQNSLESFNKPVFRTRSMRVFRDETNLDASPKLWGGITQALDQSSRFILLASPDSAASKWVRKEIIHFLADQPLSSVCVIVARGKMPWLDVDAEPGAEDCAISAEVYGLLRDEFENPFVPYLRRYRTNSGQLDRKAQDFEIVFGSIPAWILECDKEKYIGEHVAKRRRFRAFVIAIACVFAVLFALSAYQVLRTVKDGREIAALEATQAQLRKRIREITDSRNQLKQKMDEDRRRAAAFAGGVDATAEFAGQLAYRTPEILSLKNRLMQLVRKFEADFDSSALSQVDSLEIRLAKAIASNAEKRFADALQLIPEEDEPTERATTEAQIKRDVLVLQVRGNAYFGLREWQLAFTRYRRILKLQPSLLWTKNDIAICLFRLGKLEESLKTLNDLVDHYDRLVMQEGGQELAIGLARSHTNRGAVHRVFGQPDRAIEDHDKAKNIYAHLVDAEGRQELANDLAASYNNRGNARRDIGQLDEAIADSNEAIAIRTRLVEQEGRQELANDLANSHNNRGNAHSDKGQLDKAIADYNEAIRLQTHLVEQEGQLELGNDLARSYTNRGVVHRVAGRLEEAIRDFDDAIEIHTRLVKLEGRQGNVDELAAIYNNRGNTRRDQDMLDAALADFNKALDIYTCLVEEEGRWELANELAGSYNNRGNARHDKGQLGEAIKDYNTAIVIRTRLVEQEGQRQFADDLARSLNVLAWRYATHWNETHRNGALAIRHATKACELTNHRNWNFLETLAAAYAEANDFAMAIEHQSDAVELARQEGTPNTNVFWRLALYQVGKPYRSNGR